MKSARSGDEPNGDDFLYQTITIPCTATKATLTFWYWPSTTDTITYDWQEAQVQNTSGTTLAQIMKVFQRPRLDAGHLRFDFVQGPVRPYLL